MLVLRRFHNKLVQGGQVSLKAGAPTVYELREQRPPLLRIQKEIAGHLLITAGSVKQLPLPFGYDSATERLYCTFRVQGIAAFSTVGSDGVNNILIKGMPGQQGRYAFSDFISLISISNPTASNLLLQYTCFVIPDLSDDNNFFGLTEQIVAPTTSGGTGPMATTSRVYSDSARIDYTISPVTTGAWTTLIGTLSKVITHVNIFDSSGQTLELGVGTPGGESRIMIIPPGGITEDILVPQGQRLAIRAISATADVGEIDITAFS